MLPDRIQTLELKRRRLRVGDVRLTIFLHKDAARRRDAFRPAKPQYPARGVQHVNTHVTHDAVAVFLKRAPPTPMWESVVGSQRRGASPHFVIEKVGHGFNRRIAISAHVEITTHLDMGNFPKQSGVNNLLLRVNDMRRALALRADLHHAR